MKAPLSKAPCSVLFAGLLCGIICCVAAKASLASVWVATGASLFLTALLVMRRQWLVAMGSCFIAVGVLTTAAHVPALPPPGLADGRPHLLTGIVESIEPRANSQLAGIRIDSADGKAVSKFKLLLTVGDLTPTPVCGDSVRFRCRVEPVSFRDTEGHEWQLIPYTYYFSRGAGAQAFCTGSELDVTASSNHALRYLPQRIARDRAEMIARSELNTAAQSFLLGTLLGRRDAVGSDVRENFNALGVAHLLCVSGYHVGLVAWLVILTLSPLKGLRRIGRWRNLVAAVLVWLYVLVCGAQPAAVRAGIMLSVYLLAAFIEEDTQPFNSLCAAAVIILWGNPFQLFNAGFQLSVCAVAGILMFAEKLNPFPRRRHLPHSIAATILLPVSAILGTLAAQLNTFHSFPLYFLPANMLITICFPIFLVLATAAVTLGNLGFGAWVAAPANWLADGAEKLCEAVAGQQLRLENVYISDTGIFLVGMGLIVFAFALRVPYRRERIMLTVMAVLCAATGLCLTPKAPAGAVLYAWEERGRVFAALQKGHKVEIFSENGRNPGMSVQSFLHSRGAREIACPEGRKGLPGNLTVHAGKHNTPDTVFGPSIGLKILRSNMIYNLTPCRTQGHNMPQKRQD